MSRIQKETALGNLIQRLREDAGISRTDLARAAGIAASTLGQIERGEIDRPPDLRLRGIARMLNTSFDRLLQLIRKATDRAMKFVKSSSIEKKFHWPADLSADLS